MRGLPVRQKYLKRQEQVKSMRKSFPESFYKKILGCLILAFLLLLPLASADNTLPLVHDVPLLSKTLVHVVIGFGVLASMLAFDIKEPKKLIEFYIALTIIIITAVSLIELFA
jgi:glucan phosphoethanolaminetransferase (alkaline phosphatase superfamily)